MKDKSLEMQEIQQVRKNFIEKRLGKGLDALISNSANNKAEAEEQPKKGVAKIKISDIKPNPFQPRKAFGMEKMDELVNSIREKGIIQPILVRPIGDKYELVAGERRWRAAQEVHLDEIPAVIRDDIDDASSLELSIIENIQREELNPIEEAEAYQELVDKFGYTLTKVGQMVGKDKSTISNSLRLLALSSPIRKEIIAGKLSIGHAKVLLSVTNDYKREKIANIIKNKTLSVRETEKIVNLFNGKRTLKNEEKNANLLDVEEQLQQFLGTKVSIQQKKKKGKIEIIFYSNKDLQRILNLMIK